MADGTDLLWNSKLSGLKYKPSDKDNCVIVISSFNKIDEKLKYIQTEFQDAVIISIEKEILPEYALVEFQLLNDNGEVEE